MNNEKKELHPIFEIVRKSQVSPFLLYLTIILAVISSLLAILPLQFVGMLTDSLVHGGTIVTEAQDAIWLPIQFNTIPILTNRTGFELGLIILGVFLVVSVLAHLVRTIFGYFATIFADKVIVSIRIKLFAKILTLPTKFFYTTPKGTTIFRVMNDTQNLENIYSHPLYTLFSDLLDMAWITFFLYLTDPILVLLLIPPIPVLYILSIRTGKVQRAIFKDLQEEESLMSARIEQTLSNVETVKAFEGEERERELFLSASNLSLSHRIKSAKGLSIFFPIEGTLRILGVSGLLLYTLFQVKQGNYSTGFIPVVYLYGTRFYTPITNLSRYYQTLQKGVASAKRVLELLQEPQEEANLHPSPEIKMGSNGSLFVERVNVDLDNKTVLQDFSLECQPREFILIRGTSGSGKSTFLKLLLGFHKKKNGNVIVSGTNIENYQFDNLRKQFSYASQESLLHNISLLENTIYPKTLSETCEEDTLNASNLLIRLGFRKDQINKKAGEGGTLLSGGERRRITLARAVFRQSPILILDEITANLDPKNEHLILNLLSQLKGHRSIIVVSHSENPKLESLADRIILVTPPLEEGIRGVTQ